MTDQYSIEEYRDGVLVTSQTVQVPRTPEEIERRAIIAEWGTRKQAVVAALAGIQTVRQPIITANTALQAATTTAQVTAAVKQYASANLAVLGALETHTAATAGALGIIERAIAWMDNALEDMADDAP